ncbi:unnamed protein product [Orchesella dallaii]|uniref:Uncharacterized protein n=1 Tax=Orchesella dallaii TaxID=48710 RepID=A0ABP1PLP3_9HEXA
MDEKRIPGVGHGRPIRQPHPNPPAAGKEEREENAVPAVYIYMFADENDEAGEEEDGDGESSFSDDGEAPHCNEEADHSADEGGSEAPNQTPEIEDLGADSPNLQGDKWYLEVSSFIRFLYGFLLTY